MVISTSIEIMALIVAVIAAIKIIVIFVKPKAWLGLVKKVYAQPILTTIISLVLAVIVLYYLLQELTILQIFAVMLLIVLLAAINMSTYSKEMTGVAEKMLKDKKILKKAWLSVVIWVILIIWTLKELFV